MAGSPGQEAGPGGRGRYQGQDVARAGMLAAWGLPPEDPWDRDLGAPQVAGRQPAAGGVFRWAKGWIGSGPMPGGATQSRQGPFWGAFPALEAIWGGCPLKSGSLGLQRRLTAAVVPGVPGPGASPGRLPGPSPAGARPGLSRRRPGRPQSRATGRCPGPAGSCRGSPTSTRGGSGAPALPAAPGRRPGLRSSSLYGSGVWSRESSPAPAFRRPGHDGWHGGWLESAARAVARERAGRGCPPVRGTGYTGIMESVVIAASPAVGSGGPGGANAWPARLHYIRWLLAVHYIPHLVAGGYCRRVRFRFGWPHILGVNYSCHHIQIALPRLPNQVAPSVASSFLASPGLSSPCK